MAEAPVRSPIKCPGLGRRDTKPVLFNVPRKLHSDFQEDLVYKDPARPNVQKTCTFRELVYETVSLPGCAHQADSLYAYPVATACHCGPCDTDSTDCTVRGLGPSYCSFGERKEQSPVPLLGI
ncbi:follitropin subunit beta [Gracilinanus agilis]|uniref:follitropin subunit beta n=1 Tax=Gracilinanus agilis TaxID=191870 RepID=UPI001CFEF988|nr:follitropin subunit beta [Gracilinanus agilis]